MGEQLAGFVFAAGPPPAAQVRAWEWVGDDGFRILFMERVRAELWAGHNHGRLFPLVRPAAPHEAPS